MTNPYASPAEVDDTPSLELITEIMGTPRDQKVSLKWTITRWTLVCSLAAAPSFFVGLGVTQGRFAGMLTGIAIFIAMYVWVDRRTMHFEWRRSLRVQRTLVTVYVLRIIVTIIFPVGLMIDMMCGMLSLMIVQLPSSAFLEGNPGPPQLGFFMSLLTTLIQGCILNLVLFVVALALLPLIAAFTPRTVSEIAPK